MKKQKRTTSVLLRRMLYVCLSLVLVLGVALTIFAVALSGDISGDERITIFDAQMLAEDKSGVRDLNDDQQAQAEGWTVQSIFDTVLGKTPEGPVSYTVTFQDHDGTILKTETVESGKAATAPADPSRTGYIFIGWDIAFDNVTTDLTVVAQYVEEKIGPSIVLSKVTTSAGATDVVVTVSVQNNPGILGAIFAISYDSSILTLNDATNGVTAEGVSFTPPAQYKNPTTFVWDAQDLTWTEDGVILTLAFSVSDVAANGDYSVALNYDPYDIFDSNGDPIDFQVTNAVIEVR